MAIARKGRKTRLLVNGTEYAVLGISATGNTPQVDITNTLSQGFQELDEEGGIKNRELEVRFLSLEGTAQPVFDGDFVTIEEFEASADEQDKWTYSAFVSAVAAEDNEVQTENPIVWNATLASSGVITKPTRT